MGFSERLEEALLDGVQAGIITKEQSAALLSLSAQRTPSARFKATTWIAAMAGLCFALGVILVISHNWHKIPDAAKIAAFLLLLWGTAEGAVRGAGKPYVSVGLAALWFFLPVAGIGLYAQIFQLSGDAIKPYLLWAALSAPLAFLWKDSKIAYLELFLLLAVLWTGSFFAEGILNLAGGSFFGASRSVPAATAWLLSLAVIAAAGTLVARKAVKAKLLLAAAVLGWLLALTGFTQLFRCENMWLILLGAGGASLACLSVNALEDGPAQSQAPFWLWAAIPYVVSFFYKHERIPSHPGIVTAAGATLLALIFAVSACVLWFHKKTVFGKTPSSEAAARAAAIAAAALPLVCLLGPVLPAAIAANLFLFLTAAALMWHGATRGEARHVNLGVKLLTLMLATRFFDFFGSLVRSGTAFMGAGLLLAALAYAINKGRKSLLEKAAAGGGRP